MGGRGSSGVGVGRNSAVAFSAPGMSGTARQVEYATDILKNPYNSLTAQIEFNSRMAKNFNGGKYKTIVSALQTARNDYANQVSKLGSAVPNLSASMVISRRSGFFETARNLARRELSKVGLSNIEILNIVNNIRR